ncbi:alanine--tRNA ligase [Methanobrevibacter sp. DSM 116169]|uniref:alanine--tRNA ligase n=1 Tax=Methanobrevibacter sp. DSM 116169 TaxID=3242727 RepID=UPI0038FC60A5
MAEIFKQLGYEKYKCETCGEEFWSKVKRNTCGDAPCDEYSFIGNPATSKPYDLYEIQKTFREFFKSEDHTPIDRYPVLAKRWRDDVFLVGASLYDFQPWVTSGLVEPPANPLTIAQPSIRLNDVDNVGRTGRHMTCFTMGAHHAFNKENKEIYWKDETIRLCHDFIKSIGIAPEEITYIESWWSGGGNAGPCLEVCVRGVELATLVFIQYEIDDNGDKKEIPIRVVDTGYGLERFAWISQGTPTAYDACFAPVIEKLKEITNVNVDEKILSENAQIAGMMDIENYADIRALREKVADKLNISHDELVKSAEPMEAIYIIADHTRCLAFMLADGIIPSNVKEGYLARLVLRRTIRFMKELEMKESLVDIMEIQLNFLNKFYPEIKEFQEHIMNVISLEEERYATTIEKGENIVKRKIKKLKKEGVTSLPLSNLTDFYDAHGIPPETVKEIAGNDFEVDIPDNFFTLVANEHEGEKVAKEKDLNLNHEPTKLLFYDDFFQKEFKAKVLDIVKKDDDISIVLDKTVFYPEGGGQPSDIGKISINDTEFKIKYAEKINNIVLHQLESPDDITKDTLNEIIGKEISGEIDWDRRITLARHHTATHLIVAAAKKVLGNHIWQAGAQKGLNRSRIDLSHYKRITQNEIDEIESIANSYVMDNIPVNINWLSRDEAEKKYGFTLYQGGVVPGSEIRVINIPEIDTQACAGTHIPQTGNIGMIKINKTERVQDGVERIDFSAGLSAVSSMQETNKFLQSSSDIFKVTPDQLEKTCDRFFNEWKAQKNEIDSLKSDIASLKINSLSDEITEHNGLKVMKTVIDSDFKELQKIATDFTDNEKADIVLIGNNDGKILGASSSKAIDAGVKINEIITESAKILGGGGGGRPTLAQGAGPKKDKITEAIEFAYNLI